MGCELIRNVVQAAKCLESSRGKIMNQLATLPELFYTGNTTENKQLCNIEYFLGSYSNHISFALLVITVIFTMVAQETCFL